MTTITPKRSFGTNTILIVLLSLIGFTNIAQAQFSRSKNKSSNEYRNGYQRMAAGSNFNFEIRGGELWAWGNNGTGKLGDGTTFDRLSPVKIGNDNDWVSVSCGELHSVALKANGTIWTWGYNNDGQLGNGTSSFTLRLSPGQVGSATDWVSISAGGYHTTAIKANGTLWVWGQGGNGQLGDGGSGANYHINTPVQIGTGTDWVILSAGYAHTLAIKANGTLWGWGYNAYGMVGDNSGNFQITTPSQVGSDVDWVSISAGQNQSHGIKSNGTLWGWGYNGNGQLGDGTTTQRNSPTRIGTLSNWVTVTSGYRDGLGVQANGELWGWGINDRGQLGDGTTSQRISPVLLGTGYVNVCAGSYSSHSLALKANGTLWACGWNQAGQLGDGTTADQINRIQVSATTNWLTVAGGYYYTHAIKSNGTLWAWGHNTDGELGDVSNINRFSPVVISGITTNTWVSVADGVNHTLALKADGSLWAWGMNNDGRVGDGTTINRNAPVHIGTDNDWVSISAGSNHSVALKANGTLWAWGWNPYGQFGNGTTGNSLFPVQVGTESDWVSISAGYDHNLALKSNGTLWAWGRNNNGQVGNGFNTNQLTPIQLNIGTTNWTGISSGSYYSSALQSNGVRWAWGNNDKNQLGDGLTADRNTPFQVGGALNWVCLNAGGFHTLALQADGTLWNWGFNSYGEIGDGNTVNISSPLNIVSQTNVIKAAGGGYHSGIIKSDRSTICMTGMNGFGQLGNGNNMGRTTFECVVSAALNCTSAPAQPSAIVGSKYVCGLTTVTYSVTAVTGVTYTWTLRPGMLSPFYNLAGNSVTVTIDQTVGISMNGNITVTASNACGTSTASSKLISLIPGTPTSLTGPSKLCGLNTATYNCTNMGTGVTYNWVWPAGMTGPATTTVPTATATMIGTANITGSVTVTPSNACGTGGTKTKVVNSAPNNLGSITGPTNICSSSFVPNGVAKTYSVVPISGIISYVWTANTGAATFAPNGGTNAFSTLATLSSNYPTCAIITVKATNQCFVNTSKTITVCRSTALNCTARPLVARPIDMEEGAKEINLSTVNIYPNPSNGLFSVKFNANSNYQKMNLEVINLLGQKIYQTNINNPKSEINISSQQNGVYLMRLTDNTGKVVEIRKLIKE